ncbi:MAG: hypothetical protein AABY93_02670 [Bacteroidota bacterium]
MMAFSKIRKWAFFLGIISIVIIVFYSCPGLLTNHQSYKSHQFFLQPDSGDPIVYKASENLSYTHSQPKVQAVSYHDWRVTFDLPSIEISTCEALFVVASLRNVFYVFTNINAP